MNACDLIALKRDGKEMTSSEIAAFVGGITDGSIPDYQVAAWLMAVFLRGMTPRETLALTLAMRDSGQCLDLSDLPGGPVLDKHSTGGVGDKTTLVVVPIVAAAGVPMLKMSGRGLGFSGGTVDKLEAIPGFRVALSIPEAKAQVRQIGAALLAQTADLAPADKVLYALRDVTATIESLPLIVSSIMSKKLAAGGQRIVLDVKVGQGAFMKTHAQATALAQALVEVGNGAGVPTTALLTEMDEPLGYAVGNALEVQEALTTLTNAPATEPKFRALCLELAAHGLLIVGKAASHAEALQLAQVELESGRAAAKFAEIVAAQGGPHGIEAIAASLPIASPSPVTAHRAGMITAIDAEAVGRLAMRLGAGRAAKTDAIDPAVGIVLHAKTGYSVTPSTPLATLHLRAADLPRAEEFASLLRSAYQIISESEQSGNSDTAL